MAEEGITEILRPDEIESQKLEIRYQRPKFIRRVFANLLDIIIFAFTFVLLLLGSRAIVQNSASFKANDEAFNSIRLRSGIYDKNKDGQVQDIVTIINEDKNNTGGSKVKKAKKGIETFLTFMKEECGQEVYEEVSESYNTYRLDEKLTYTNDAGITKPLFVISESSEIVENPELVDGQKATYYIFTYYYEKAYAPYIDEYLQGYLATRVNGYYDLAKYFSNTLIFAEILPAYAVSGLLTYLLPMLIFRRGRMTFGKAAYRICLVDKDVLSPKLGRTFARFAIFYFAELLLSLFTFGLPYIISFSLMVFSKNKQGFPDFMLGLNEVDGSKNKVYLSYDELDLDSVNVHKDPPNFRVKNFD